MTGCAMRGCKVGKQRRELPLIEGIIFNGEYIEVTVGSSEKRWGSGWLDAWM